MAEYIERDYHYSTRYALIKNGERIEFNSEQDACEFLGVKKCSVSSCFRKGYKCKGYEIERCGISTHGETKTRLHKIWESMIARCEYEKHPYYADYGGSGITVCDKWHSYIEFRDWAITHGYNDDLKIDRIKNEEGYDASNCRWTTMREQQNNKRSNHIVYLGEVGHTISEWSEILGIGKTTIRMRLESGWSDEDALTVPVRKRMRGYRPSASCGAKIDGHGGADMKNEYILKLQAKRRAEDIELINKTCDYVADIMTLALNREGFGKERIKRVNRYFDELNDEYMAALQSGSDYANEKLKAAVRDVMGEER